MSEKKHIDRLFQEKFKDFEVTPDDAVWENIQNALHEDKPKRRVIPFWWKLSGAAAILILFLTIGNVIFHKDAELNHPDHKVVDTEINKSAEQPYKNNTVNDYQNSLGENDPSFSKAIANTDKSEDASVQSENKNTQKKPDNTNKKLKTTSTIVGADSSRGNGNRPSNLGDEPNIFLKEQSIISNSKEEAIVKNAPKLPQPDSENELIIRINQLDKSILETDKKRQKIAGSNSSEVTDKVLHEEAITSLKEAESIEEAIAKAIPTNEEEKEEQPNRWNITPNVAPVYFNSLGKGSTIDNQFVNNTKSGEVNMSYGISGSYAINEKIKIRAGVNKVDLGYSTNGVIAFNDAHSFNVNSKREELQNVDLSYRGAVNSYMSKSSINATSAPQFVVSNAEGSLEQQFGYIEVPLEVEYNIVNNKFGLNVIGGFSTLFLNNNAVFSVSENERFLLGEANNINSTSYSANFGLGVNYNVSQHLKLNLEPMFKYQINTFSNTSGDFRPYFIGVYTGFSFKF